MIINENMTPNMSNIYEKTHAICQTHVDHDPQYVKHISTHDTQDVKHMSNINPNMSNIC